jgi:hypothetical protein
VPAHPLASQEHFAADDNSRRLAEGRPLQLRFRFFEGRNEPGDRAVGAELPGTAFTDAMRYSDNPKNVQGALCRHFRKNMDVLQVRGGCV